GDLPAQVPVTEQAGVPVFAFPALRANAQGDAVAVRLARTPEEASAWTARGLTTMLDLALRYDLAWLQKDLKALRELGTLVATLAPVAELQEQAYANMQAWLTDDARVRREDGLREQDFNAAVA